jgi:hypothetical protein
MPRTGSPKTAVDTLFTRAEWDLLVKLPGQVVIAATSAEADSPSRTVAEGLAGLDAIAAGRSSENPLVRRVVATIYAEPDEDTPTAQEFADRAAGLAGVLDACRHAAGVLGRRAEPDDRRAYQEWIFSIADRVCGASRSGGVLGVGGMAVSPAERKFLADMTAAFGG